MALKEVYRIVVCIGANKVACLLIDRHTFSKPTSKCPNQKRSQNRLHRLSAIHAPYAYEHFSLPAYSLSIRPKPVSEA